MTGFDFFFVHDILNIYGMKIDETGESGKGAGSRLACRKDNTGLSGSNLGRLPAYI